MDPQHRVFLEATWAALENAALPPRTGLYDAVVGVFAAAGIDGYLVHHLDGRPLKDSMNPQDIFLAEIGNEKDYIATRVSYLLDFTGPSMNVNSACSSALVACVQAASAITVGQCSAAVAGASSITFPNLGFLYQDGLVNSQDGYVRPFDEGADGTVFGDSVASLVLRRADEAGGLVWGALRGFAVTNDGGQKAGYAAPSPLGQSLAVMGAMQMMGEDPWSVSYVECHCTGTRVGDGIEVRGLVDAFVQLGGKKGPGEDQVALGSVKGNIAHANCAAGATGLAKVLLMLRSRQRVPTANFSRLNPKISLERKPFFVNSEICSWGADSRPLRAGVSSFGIGGTNAHVVLEEVPAPEPNGQAPARWNFQVLPLSARSPEALLHTGQRVAAGLRAPVEPRASLARAAFTLQAGRAALPLRKAVVLPVAVSEGQHEEEDLVSAAELLEGRLPDVEELEELEEVAKRPQVAFVFPGQGSQYFGMARGLYGQVPLFRRACDRSCELLAAQERLGRDLRPLLFPSVVSAEEESRRLEEFERPSVLQPALFVVEHALAQVFHAVGVVPVAAAGHSLGEYAAAVAGGLLTLESALDIVAARAKATETLAEDGAMLSVAGWSEQELSDVGKGQRPGLWLAAVNSPVHAVISGEETAVDALEAELRAAGKKCTKLHVKKAFHSGLVAKAANELRGLGLPSQLDGSAPAAAVPVASNFTGGWLSSMQLRDGSYWAGHMRGTVRWRENAEKLLTQWQPTAVVEVGPGNALSTLTAKCVGANQSPPVFVQAMRHPKATSTDDVEALLSALGQLWEAGYTVDWRALHTKVLGATEPPRPLRLPSYAFDPIRLWVNPERSAYVENVEEPAPATYAGGTAPVVPTPVPAPRLLVRFGEKRSQEPPLRAYCLPFASGSAALFAPWAEALDGAVEVVAVELPGRGARADDAPPRNEAEDEAMLASLGDALLADLRGAQYILVGFSMGGGLCVDLALRLAERGAPPPLALYVAGRKPPALDPASIGAITMSDEALAEYAFAPPEVASSPEFREHVVPLLRADLEIDARCERRLSEACVAGRRLPQGVGLELFCGTNDAVAPWVEAPGWQRFAEELVGVHYYPGGHEFMQEHRPLLHTAWRRDALGRLVRQRSAEVAMLAAQGFAAPGAALAAGLPSAGPPASTGRGGELPLYAVRWVPVAGGSAGTPVSPCFVDLSEELREAALVDAAAALRAGASVVAVASADGAGLLTPEAMEAEVQQCWQFTRLVQRLLEEGCAGHLLVVCPAAVSGAMVVGASKAVALEAGELRIQRLFVPLACLAEAHTRAQDLLKFASRHAQETDVWVQDSALESPALAPRMEPMPETSARLPCFPPSSADGSLPVFLLTGATGGLGRSVVRWMLEEQRLQPQQLVLLRRSGSGLLTGELAGLRVVEMDNADEVLGLRDVRGVAGLLHLAGILDDGVVGSMTEERFRTVAEPKCGLLAALLQAARTLGWPLRWAVGFSSTSSLLGYAGQTNYCAANAVLDQLAAFSTANAPCRVLAVNWGPWAEAGMAKVGTKAYEQAVKDGDRPLPTAQALACLATALRCASQAQPAAVQLCACDVDWQRSQWRGLPLLTLLGDGLGPVAVAEAAAAAPAGAAREAVEGFLLQHAKGAGSWRRAQGKSLQQLGLDSLEVVQLRNLFNKRFGTNVPLSLVADPSRKLGELTEELLQHMGP
uniref:Type I polyketide sythase n=1 Tax=Gambierdiscus polynesiensis TaxID=439318 RepID=A0A6M5KDR8_9DINO|nr:type I polyketide sythase [Gambierdiscus polynesiensis]